MRQDFLNLQCEINSRQFRERSSSDNHREMVMKLIAATVTDLVGHESKPCSSIVLLGAGHCVDVDLKRLSQLFSVIHLVDLDRNAVDDAVKASALPTDKLKVHAPIDVAEPLLSLTGMDFNQDEANFEHRVNVLQHLSRDNAVLDIPEADVVVSLCLFTQLIDTLRCLVPEGHASYESTVKAVRIGNLRRMLSMLRLGGVAIFLTDMASSDTSDLLESATDETIGDVVRQLVSEENYCQATNPSLLLADLNVLSRLPNGPESIHTTDPWLWRLGDRILAVYGSRIQKKLPVVELPNDGAEIN